MTRLTKAAISEVMAAMGRKGQRSRMRTTTPEQRSEMMRKAALKRWRTTGKKKAQNNS